MAWRSAKRESRNQVELIARSNALIDEKGRERRAMENMTDWLARMGSAAVSARDVLESFTPAVCRGDLTGDADPRA
jgi:hypothetical protein